MLGGVLLEVRMLRRRQELGRAGWLLELETVVVDHLRACVHGGRRLLMRGGAGGQRDRRCRIWKM